MRKVRPRAFVSSRMKELASERAALKAALAELGIDAFVFEDDAGARAQGIRDTYLDELDAADLYIGLFGRGYGAYTVEEFEHAQALGLDCLVYEKHDGSPREAALQAFLDRVGHVETGTVTPGWFADTDELLRRLPAAIARWREGFDSQHRQRAAAVRHGLPARPPLGFVGRDVMLADGAARLRAGEDVLLAGMPGAGKTTLASALVRHRGVERRFRDGMLWASLGSQADATAALAAWARALVPGGALEHELVDAPGLEAQTEVMRRALADRVMLLVIDDAWDGAAATALRCGGPQSAHLLTTRDLDVARTFGGGTAPTTLHELGDDDAFALLRHLAPEACAADEPGVRALARAVGGLPQALRIVGGQLARAEAGRFAAVFPELGEQALDDLQDPAARVRLVGERLGGRAVSLKDTVLASVADLPADAREAFAALGAFAPKPERFDRDAALAVTGRGARALARLAARHLLDVDNATRSLAVHPTLADVAREQTDADAVAAHREHLLARVRAASDPAVVDALHGQVRWAWQQAPVDMTLAVMMGVLHPYHLRRGLHAERLAWALRCRPVAESQADAAMAVAGLLKHIGELQSRVGRHRDAVASLDDALARSEGVAEPAFRIDTQLFLAIARHHVGRSEAGLATVQAARAAAATHGESTLEAEARAVTAMLLRDLGRFDLAQREAMQAILRYRELGDHPNEADALMLMASILRDEDRPEHALEHHAQARRLRENLGHDHALSDMDLGDARVHLETGRLPQALQAAQAALARAEDEGNSERLIDFLTLLGDVRNAMGDADEALAAYRQALARAESDGLGGAAANVLADIGHLHHMADRAGDALAAFERARALHREAGRRAPEARVLHVMAHAHGALGEPEAQMRCLASEADLWRDLGDAPRLQAALGAMVVATRLSGPADGPRALAAASAELVAQPDDAASMRARLTRRRDACARLGTAWLGRFPPPDIVIRCGARADALPTLTDEVDAVCRALRTSLGWALPAPVFVWSSTWMDADAIELELFGVPRLRVSAHDALGTAEAARALHRFLHANLASFVGHDALLRRLAHDAPEAAARLRERPRALATLVATARGLVEEGMPLRQLPALARCFETVWLRRGDRLAVADAVRRLPTLRPLLPGNEPGTALVAAGPAWEGCLAAAIDTGDGLPTIRLDPDDSRRCLAAVREWVAEPDRRVALLVEDAHVRRFLWRLVSLAFDDLPVLARDELDAAAEARVIGELRW